MIPADHKWFRNFAVSRIIVETLESLRLKFPNGASPTASKMQWNLGAFGIVEPRSHHWLWKATCNMIQRNLGKSSLRVSLVGLDAITLCMRIDLEATAQSGSTRHLDLGINFFDTSDTYGNRGGSETMLGQILGKRRGEVVLATKFGGPMDDEGKKKGASRAYIMAGIEDSLRRLQTDYVDLYQIHFPDPKTPMEETLRALARPDSAGQSPSLIGCSKPLPLAAGRGRAMDRSAKRFARVHLLSG